MRIAQSADWHVADAWSDQVWPAIDWMAEDAIARGCDAFIFAGDACVRHGELSAAERYRLNCTLARLAQHMEVVVIDGNHDIERDTGMSALKASLTVDAEYQSAAPDRTSLIDRVHYYGQPGVCQLRGAEFVLLLLPNPTRQLLRAALGPTTEAEVSAHGSKLLHDIVRGIVAKSQDRRFIMVFHGLVQGGRSGPERILGTDTEISIDLGELPDAVEAVMAGHLHLAQEVQGPHCQAVYASSPCPVGFEAEGFEPSYVVWDIDSGAPRWERVPIPVKHPTIKIDLEIQPDDATPMETVKAAIEARRADIPDAVVRVRVKVPDEKHAAIDRDWIAGEVGAAYQQSVTVEKVVETRIRVRDVRADAGIDDLVGFWIEANPELETHRAALAKVARETDGILPPEVIAGYKAQGYEPLWVEWQNFAQFRGTGRVEFDDLGRTVCLSGRNGDGKSNWIAIEELANWGICEAGKWDASWVTTGESLGMVECGFRSGEHVYRTRRTMDVSKARPKGSILVQQRNGAGWEPVDKAKLPELVGNRDMFLATRFGAQRDIDRLVRMRPSEFKEALEDALGTGLFDHRKKAAASLLKVWTADLHRTEGRIETLETSLADDALANQETAVLDLFEKMTAAQVRLELARQHHEAARGVVTDLERRQAQRTAAETALSDATVALSRAAGERSRVSGELEKAQRDAGALPECRTQVEELGRLRELRGKLETSAQRDAELRADIEERTRTHDRLRQHREREHATQTERLRSLRAGASVDKPEDCERGDCNLIAAALKAKRQIPELEAAVELLAKPSAEEREIERGLEPLIAEQGRLRPILKQRDEIGRLIASLERAKWETKLGTAEAAAARAKELAGRVDEVSQAACEAETKRRECQTARDEIADLSDEIKTAADAVTNGRTGEEQANTELRLATSAHAVATASHTQLVQRKTALTDERETAQGQRHEIMLWTSWEKACGRDGLPFLLLEGSLPQMEGHVNGILERADVGGKFLRVRLEPVKDLASGETRNDISPWMITEHGEFRWSKASGYQRVALGYSLRAALARVRAEAHGAVARGGRFDEGWGAFDPENMVAGVALLMAVAECFDQVIYISHVPAMIDAAETVIDVGGGTVCTREA